MHRILFNQYRIKDKELLYNLYSTFLKTEGADRDIYDVVKWAKEGYEANKFFASPEAIKEQFKTFELTEETFPDEASETIYLKEEAQVYREKYRDDILTKLLNKTIPAEKRLELIDELTKLEMQVFDLKDTVADVSQIDAKEMYAKRKNKGKGLLTNIPEIDNLTQGMLSGKIMVVLAGPKSGKSMFALNMCYINLKIPDNNSLFISLEIPKDELMYKMWIRLSYDERKDISFMKTIRGQLDADEEQTLYGLSETFNKYMPSKLYILASNDLRGDSILTIKQQIVDTIQSKGIKTIYVDYLQLMKFGFNGKGNIYEYLNEVVGMFRWIAVAYDVRIVLLSQATKEGIKRGKRFSI